VAVRFGQRGLEQSLAAAKVVVDGGQIHCGQRGNGLAGRGGETALGHERACGLQDAGARGFAIGAEQALGHEGRFCRRAAARMECREKVDFLPARLS
jgi:hypothetical protein